MTTEVVNDGRDGNRAMGRRAFIGRTAHERRHGVDVVVAVFDGSLVESTRHAEN